VGATLLFLIMFLLCLFKGTLSEWFSRVPLQLQKR
jgi:hypothetical protein